MREFIVVVFVVKGSTLIKALFLGNCTSGFIVRALIVVEIHPVQSIIFRKLYE